MGSHGGATAEGQRELLASYDIDEAHLGVPVVTDMDAVTIGTNSWGEPVWWDKNALAADGVVTVSRVKPHTDFRGKFESGIVKMLVIGLGKRHGADQVHRCGTRGLRDMIPESGKVILEKTPFLGGLADPGKRQRGDGARSKSWTATTSATASRSCSNRRAS